jgi:hypothetical protein
VTLFLNYFSERAITLETVFPPKSLSLTSHQPDVMRSLLTDYSLSLDFEELKSRIDDGFVQALEEVPELVLSSLALALHQVR